MGDHLIAFSQLDRRSRAQPSFQTARLAKLSHVNRGHEYNVTHNVSHSQVQHAMVSRKIWGSVDGVRSVGDTGAFPPKPGPGLVCATSCTLTRHYYGAIVLDQ